jgi:hypothetical protein
MNYFGVGLSAVPVWTDPVEEQQSTRLHAPSAFIYGSWSFFHGSYAIKGYRSNNYDTYNYTIAINYHLFLRNVSTNAKERK